jgi:uncharacterized protein YkwD
MEAMRRRAVRRLANKARKAHRKPGLRHSAELTASAQAKANELARTGHLAHGQWWRGIYAEIRKSDWGRIGENIASGQTSPAQVHGEWMDSPEHRANILNGEYDHLGVGWAKSRHGKQYYVQHFGNRR